MSDSLAIAAATASLAELLAGPVEMAVPGARVTMLRPNAPDLLTGEPLLNLALIAAEPVIETRAPPGQAAGPPPLALRLAYFLAAYGSGATQEPQRLLGAALGAIHAQPVLSPAFIAAAIARLPWLAGRDLATGSEPIRLTAVPLGAERLAGLAASLGAPGVPGAVYELRPVPLGPP